MSAGRRPDKSSWLARNYEKLALIVALVGLLVSAVILVTKISLARMALTEARWEKPAQQKDVEPLDIETLREAIRPLIEPFQSGATSNLLFVSELRISCINAECGRPIAATAAACPFCLTAQPEVKDPKEQDYDGDQIPNGVEELLGLDPLNPADALLDMDGDGFNNVEEYQFGTSLTDAEQFPELPAKLRVVAVRKQPFILRFQGVNELPDGKRFLLNLRSLEKSYFVKVGDEVEGFNVYKFDEAAAAGPTLELRKGTEFITLVKGVPLDSHEIVARLVFLLDKSIRDVKLGDPVKLKTRTYKVVDIKPNSVSISDDETGKIHPIPLLTEGERSMLRGEPVLPAPDTGMPGPAAPPGYAPPPRVAAPVTAPVPVSASELER